MQLTLLKHLINNKYYNDYQCYILYFNFLILLFQRTFKQLFNIKQYIQYKQIGQASFIFNIYIKQKQMQKKLFKNNHHSNHLTNHNRQQNSSKQFISNIMRSVKVIIYENNNKHKTRDKLGQYFRMQKTFFYKQRIIILYMLNYLIQNKNSQSKQIKQKQKAILNMFYQSINIFEVYLNEEVNKNSQQSRIIQNLKQNKNKLIKLLDNLKQTKHIYYDQLEQQQLLTFLDILLTKWTIKQKFISQFYQQLQYIFDNQLMIQKVQNSNIITQLIIIPIKNHLIKQQKHLLYKNCIITISSNKITQIIQTNQQKYVFFNLLNQYDQIKKQSKQQQQQNKQNKQKQYNKQNYSIQQPQFYELLQTKSKMSELFEEKDRKQVYQSQGDKSQSDNKSQIVKDEQFFRITQKISTDLRKYSSDMRKYSYNQGQNNIIQNNNLLRKNCLYDSNYLGFITQYKMQNPLSQIYTRSSSLQKNTFPFKDNLTTSIDLLMRLELQTQKKRKKSCQNARTYHKSIDKIHDNKINDGNQRIINNHHMINNNYDKVNDNNLAQKINPKLKINLYNQDKNNLYCQHFQIHKNKKDINFIQVGDNISLNRRLGIARSFFKTNQQQYKD